MSPRVVLVGLPGSGKTTIGKRLANALHTSVVDTDHMIEERYGKSCGEVFNELGEAEFRKVEAQAVSDALKTDGIVSLGGGAVVTPSNRELLSQEQVVYLHVSAEEGVRRTSGSDARPLLNVENPTARYEELIKQRAGYYEEVASLLVYSDGKELQRVVTDILQFIDDVAHD